MQPLAFANPANDPNAVIGWTTLALINAGIAQGKNRSGLNWFLLSVFFGPIATFALVIFYETLDRKRQR
jgi:hypothetical protein